MARDSERQREVEVRNLNAQVEALQKRLSVIDEHLAACVLDAASIRVIQESNMEEGLALIV